MTAVVYLVSGERLVVELADDAERDALITVIEDDDRGWVTLALADGESIVQVRYIERVRITGEGSH